MIDKTQIAAVLDEIGTLLSLQGENDFRCRAYHNGARAIEQFEGNIAEAVEKKALSQIKGIGNTLQTKITELVLTGKMEFYEKLKASMPPGLTEMLRIPGLGPKKIKILRDNLKIDTIEKLSKACTENKIANLKGFGEKSQAKILEGIAFLDKVGKRFLLPDAEQMAEKLLKLVRSVKGVIRSEACGSLRRRKETVADLDILVSANNAEAIMDAFTTASDVLQILGRGPTKSSVLLQNGLQADLRVVEEAAFPFALHYFTGSKDHNIAMRQRAIDRGLKLNEYSIEGSGKKIVVKEEKDLFAVLDMEWIPPELRENTGEILAAESKQLPELITQEDLQGTLHCHSTWSDGVHSIKEMALTAKALGLKYFGLGDHSKSLVVANGLTVDRLKEQHKEIDKLNEELSGIEVLKGSEVDILGDGKLDYSDKILASFDYVVASVHTLFNLPREEMTKRIIKAMENPYVDILGHATGRLLLKREGYAVDLDAVIKAAARTGTIIEINAHPVRLDLDWLHVKQAKAAGVNFVINPDAHATNEIALIRYGIDVARRGWLVKKDVINTESWTKARKMLKRNR